MNGTQLCAGALPISPLGVKYRVTIFLLGREMRMGNLTVAHKFGDYD